MNSRPPIHPLVASVDLSMVCGKLLRPEGGHPRAPAEVALQELEYRRFLTMRLLHPDEVLVPTKFVDEIWHAHILDTVAYAKDTHRLFGRFLHHFPYFGIRSDDDAVDLSRAFARTCELYERTLGAPPVMSPSARCGDDHVCHAPSSCACRVESACK